jgi:hypothetical protein
MNDPKDTLPKIGTTPATRLKQVGIDTIEKLTSIGAEDAFIILILDYAIGIIKV